MFVWFDVLVFVLVFWCLFVVFIVLVQVGLGFCLVLLGYFCGVFWLVGGLWGFFCGCFFLFACLFSMV